MNFWPLISSFNFVLGGLLCLYWHKLFLWFSYISQFHETKIIIQLIYIRKIRIEHMLHSNTYLDSIQNTSIANSIKCLCYFFYLVPTQKMPRLLTTSAFACRRLLRKAELMGVDTRALELQEAQIAALVDVRRKWHIPPAFRYTWLPLYWLIIYVIHNLSRLFVK